MGDTLSYDPRRGLGTFDRMLVRGASQRLSGEELSALTNGAISAQEAMERVLQICESRDWLSQAQLRMFILDDMLELKDELQQNVLQMKDEASVKPLISLLTTIDKTLAADKFDLTKAMAEINRSHANIMLSAISLALERSFLELEKRYPQVSKAELTEIFQTAMPDVVREIESRVPSVG